MLERVHLGKASDEEKWDEFVRSHPKGSPFHLTCWIRMIQKTYSFEPLLYAYINGTGSISGIFPFFMVKGPFGGTRVVSLPFSDYCGPLFDDEFEESESLIKIIEEYKNRVKCIEIRSKMSNAHGLDCFCHYKRHVLKLLPDPVQLLTTMDKKTIQRCIKRAEKLGVKIREENNERGLEEFYRLNQLTRKKHGVPSQPKSFFKNLFDQVILSGNGYILLATIDSKVISGAVFLRFKDTVYYKYNASDPEYLSKMTPNHLLTWRAIEQACLEGYSSFDFCRTSPDNLGLMRYKEMWGADPLDLPYYFYPQVKGATSMEGSGLLYRIFTSAWRALPDSLVEAIGPKIYRFMG
jgi:CelD/BcsL family acetyltransferase involved in cellulose biosynthesis